jgi:hypothetical protein
MKTLTIPKIVLISTVKQEKKWWDNIGTKFLISTMNFFHRSTIYPRNKQKEKGQQTKSTKQLLFILLPTIDTKSIILQKVKYVHWTLLTLNKSKQFQTDWRVQSHSTNNQLEAKTIRMFRVKLKSWFREIKRTDKWKDSCKSKKIKLNNYTKDKIIF